MSNREIASPGRRQLAGTSGFRVSLPDASVYTELWSLRVISVADRVHQLKKRDETGRRVRFYVALGLVTAATLMLQIIETRIISVTSWYHLAFFVISIAMFGLTELRRPAGDVGARGPHQHTDAPHALALLLRVPRAATRPPRCPGV